MPLLREEAEKLSNNELEQGVIETIIDRDDLFAILPFMKITSKAYLYNREKTLSEATFIDVNDTIPEGAATFEECVAKLRILAGDVDVDKFWQPLWPTPITSWLFRFVRKLKVWLVRSVAI